LLRWQNLRLISAGTTKLIVVAAGINVVAAGIIVVAAGINE
jgi:hypothetical protein